MKNQQLLNQLSSDPSLRKAAARESHRLFFPLYLGHYIKYHIAPFQEEMFAISEDPEIELVVITAFRYSAKSTIMTFSYPIWAILGKPQKKFVFVNLQSFLKNEIFRSLATNLKGNTKLFCGLHEIISRLL